MSTVVSPQAASSQAAAPLAAPANTNGSALWLGYRLPIIIVTGEPNSGKTLFGLGVDPNCRNPAAPQTTRHWDFEGSAEPYEGALNFERVDSGRILALRKPNYTPMDAFIYWRNDMLSLPPGKFRVGVIDPFDDIEKGMVEYVQKHPAEFGRTEKQYRDAASMFLWPDVKAFAKRILYSEVRSRLETLVLVCHLKNEWKGRNPTGQRIPEGLDILNKLSTLTLWLDRSPPAKGKRAPTVPRGIVRKQRLVRFVLDGDGEEHDQPILPPCLPKATASAIRAYIQQPADYADLKPDERMPDERMTEDDRLIIQAAIAADNAAAAQATLTQSELIAKAGAAQAAAMGHAASAVGYTIPPTEQAAASEVTAPAPLAAQPQAAAPSAATAAPAAPAAPRAASADIPAYIIKLRALVMQTLGSPEAARKVFLERGWPAPLPQTMGEDDAARVTAELMAMQRPPMPEQQAAAAPATTTALQVEPQPDGRHGPIYDGENCLNTQTEEITRLWDSLGVPIVARKKMVESRGAASAHDLSIHQATELIGKLKAKLLEVEANQVFGGGEGVGNQGSGADEGSGKN